MAMKKLFSPWWALVTLVLILMVRISDPSFVESVRLRYFDTLITSKETTVSQTVHVVNIDEQTVKQKGQFPFPRGEYAKLIQSIYEHGAGMVVFNTYLPEPDRFGQDYQLANTLKKYPVVFPQVAIEESFTSDKFLPFRPGVSVIGGDPATTGVKYGNIQPNNKFVNDTAAGVGVVNTMPEIDGVTRRVPMVVNSKGQLYPSISLETLRVAAGDPSFQVKVNDYGIEAVRIPQFGKISTDALGRIWVDWSSKPQEHSASKLPQSFNGGIVIVGLTAKGLNNPVATASGAVYPHYLQSAVIDTLANGIHIERPDWADGAEILALALLGLGIILLSRWTYVGLSYSLLVIVAAVPVTRYVFSEFSTLVDATMVLGGVVIVALHAYGIKFVSEFLQKQQIKKQFGTYLSPALVEKLQKNPELLRLGGESRELSIMFTDVRGFTSISEHYGKNVQGLTEIMNRYMTAMTAKILENEGTLDKYIGDAQMAFWNAPLDDAQHAKNAVRTGLQMMGSLDAFNEEITKEGVPAFGMGLGINTDTVVVGNMGSSQRFDYTCLGDGVNLASRLEGQSKPYGVKIVLGKKTAEYVQDEYFVLELDKIAVKGKKEGVNIYTVLDNPKKEWDADKVDHDKMLQTYRNKDFIKAAKMAKKLLGTFDNHMDLYYNAWIERCDEMASKELPADWDGTYIATSK
jgi:adenylate cyclase